MTADVSPLLVLQARAEARAILYAAGEFELNISRNNFGGEISSLERAVVPLLQYAMDSGVIDQVGADGAFGIIKQAFAGVAEI